MYFRAKNRREIFSYILGLSGFLNGVITFLLFGTCWFFYKHFSDSQYGNGWVAGYLMLFTVLSAIFVVITFFAAYKIAKNAEPKNESILGHLSPVKYKLLNFIKNFGKTYSVAIFLAIFQLYYIFFK